MLPPLMIEGRPHWEHSFPEEMWPYFQDFRNFLTMTWDHLGLPEPTEAQLQIACRLQYGVDSVEWGTLTEPEKAALSTEPRSDIVRAFRGVGKSYVTAAFAAWKLMRNPRDEKLLVVSATGKKSQAFVNQLKALLETMSILQWLMEGQRENGVDRRDQSDRFDVAHASLSQSPSVRAAGITGQVTGDRATTIISDDIEIPRNSSTEEARETIVSIVREFDVIVKTEHGRGDVIGLGTPQTEESVYNRMVTELGYKSFTIPVRFPSEEKLANYQLKDNEGRVVDILAHYLKVANDNGSLKAGELTDPKRFTVDELVREELKGRAYFALQMMLDTSLSDAERYPLRQSDFIVMSCSGVKAPTTIQWGHHTDRKNRIDDIGNVGFMGDHFLRPLMIDDQWGLYEQSVLFVDPSGRGKDETGWCVIKALHGVLYLCDVGGERGDVNTSMLKIALKAKEHKVGVIQVEPNYGGPIWISAFLPILQKVWPGGCSVEEAEWSNTQKEQRIIDTLEPVMSRHRMVIDEDLVRRESQMQGEDLVYSFLYQLTHITRDRGSLHRDDRLDAVAGAVAYLQQHVQQDVDEAAKALEQERRQRHFDNLVERMERGVGQDRGRVLSIAAWNEEDFDLDDDGAFVYRTKIG